MNKVYGNCKQCNEHAELIDGLCQVCFEAIVNPSNRSTEDALQLAINILKERRSVLLKYVSDQEILIEERRLEADFLLGAMDELGRYKNAL